MDAILAVDSLAARLGEEPRRGAECELTRGWWTPAVPATDEMGFKAWRNPPMLPGEAPNPFRDAVTAALGELRDLRRDVAALLPHGCAAGRHLVREVPDAGPDATCVCGFLVARPAKGSR